ncbi:hypothetical protein GCM10027265_17450 [Jatrophihabitans fulvus]
MSARLDDEPLGMSPSVLDSHLSSCSDCARWAEDAAVVTRQARLDVTPVPDLSDVITAGIALPARRVLRRRHWLRVLLGVIGVAQLAIGLPAIFGDELGMAMSSHGAHEGAAWNLAIGVAFLAAASVPRRATGLVPLLATFTVVLMALSIHDVAAGVVTVGRIATHAAVVAGLLVLLLLDRAERALPPGRFDAGRQRRRDDDDKPGLRSVA